MDIILATGSECPALCFRNWRRFEDASGYRTKIAVRTEWIIAERDIFFEAETLHDFIAALDKLAHSLSGTARLKPLWEEPFVALDGNGRGGIAVRGLMLETGDYDQRVEFAFTTDQTCLAPLIHDLKIHA